MPLLLKGFFLSRVRPSALLSLKEPLIKSGLNQFLRIIFIYDRLKNDGSRQNPLSLIECFALTG